MRRERESGGAKERGKGDTERRKGGRPGRGGRNGGREEV